ncbi:TraR/DksA family transcriptional regulator [Nitratifractor sp.]
MGLPKEEFRRIVLEEIEGLEKRIAQLEAKNAPVAPDCSLGRLTRLEAMGEQEVNSRILEESRLRLVRLRNALLRMERGDFGLCIECGEPIAEQRLRIRPESLRCIECADGKDR